MNTMTVMKRKEDKLQFSEACLRATCLYRAMLAAVEGRVPTPEECFAVQKQCPYAPKKGAQGH